jgi:hypothetical protein
MGDVRRATEKGCGGILWTALLFRLFGFRAKANIVTTHDSDDGGIE